MTAAREWRLLREVLARVPWGAVVLGWVGAASLGGVFGLLVMRLGWWPEGAGWERHTLVLVHATVRPWLDPVFLWIPYAGTNYTLVPFIAAAAVLLWLRGHRFPALHLFIIQLGSWTLNPALKFLLDRPRPDLYPLRGQFAFPSYPSGHSIAVTSVLFTAAYVQWRVSGARWGFVVAAIVFLLNQYSRLYLAVHYPTDIIGGMLIGAVWLASGIAIFGPRYERRQAPHRAMDAPAG